MVHPSECRDPVQQPLPVTDPCSGDARKGIPLARRAKQDRLPFDSVHRCVEGPAINHAAQPLDSTMRSECGDQPGREGPPRLLMRPVHACRSPVVDAWQAPPTHNSSSDSSEGVRIERAPLPRFAAELEYQRPAGQTTHTSAGRISLCGMSVANSKELELIAHRAHVTNKGIVPLDLRMRLSPIIDVDPASLIGQLERDREF